MESECCLAEESWQSQQDGIRINKLEDTFCRRIFSAAPLQGQTRRSARQTTMPKAEKELKLALIRFNRKETSVQSGFITAFFTQICEDFSVASNRHLCFIYSAQFTFPSRLDDPSRFGCFIAVRLMIV